MKILALEREKPDLTPAEVQPHLMDEARVAWRLVQKGIFREMYFTAEEHTAVIMLEADSLEAAREILAGLPLVREGLIEFEVIPLRPYDGFARLFS
jgi:muconolactone delta-isomerase